MSGPNKEQRPAIEHHGGVILSAGAGSGKTYVLVQHMIFLASDMISKSYSSEIELNQALKRYFSKIVLMTYTKKAAGELAVRLKSEFKSIAKKEPHRPWGNVIQAIDSMYVGTIHGFCFRLLSQGYFPEVGGDISIISEIEAKDRIERLFESWLSSHREELKLENPLLYDLVISDRAQILNSMISIFSSPELRIEWRRIKSLEDPAKYLEKYDSEVLKLYGIDHALSQRFPYEPYAQGTKAKWPNLMETYYEWKAKSDRFTFNGLVSFLDTVKALGVRKPGGKNADSDLLEYFDALKKHLDVYRGNKEKENILSYLEHAQEGEICWQYFNLLKQIFDYIEAAYDPSGGLTFSDLEFCVLSGLQDPELCRRVSQSYDYFIVDEFQDTSDIQFQILDKLIHSDYNKLFCVGDVKQAIYGFRGGEVSVFQKCQKIIPAPLDLVSNYRSCPKIINFNNHFFDFIFSKVKAYEEDPNGDRFSVDVKHQEVPEGKDYKGIDGEVVKYQVNLDVGDEDEKLKTAEINNLEAEQIYNQILNRVNITPDSSVCVLYRRLSPSLFLIERILNSGLSLKAQVKVQYEEDPLLCLFRLSLDYAINFNNQLETKTVESTIEKAKRTVAELLLLHLQVFGLKIDSDYESKLNDLQEFMNSFSVEVKEWGVGPAFDRLLFNLGISNSNHVNNKSLVDSIVSISHGELETCWQNIDEYSEANYSVEFQLNGRGKVYIMTAHASKGLQFDHIFLGGVHSNGHPIGNRSTIGKEPGSFKWKMEAAQLTRYETPQMNLEKRIDELKDFAELKRLFYVACTRAIQSINWVDIYENGERVKSHKDSWINGFRRFEESSPYANLIETKVVDIHDRQADVSTVEELSEGEDSLLIPPLFHRDSLGISLRPNSFSESLKILPELSVTRLASVTLCPRKFYFQNILKFSEMEMNLISELKLSEVANLDSEEDVLKFEREEKALNDLNMESIEALQIKAHGQLSANERGSIIHDEISKFLIRGLRLPRTLQLDESLKILEWIKQQIQNQYTEDLTGVELVSETPVKFPLFGHMISGIPDLIIFPKEETGQNAAVWDFKTGKVKKGKSQDVYWFQLYCYAYYLFYSNKVEKTASVDLALVYVDAESVEMRKVDYSSLVSFLKPYWGKVNKPDQINKNHCDYCMFGNLCHF